MTEIKSFKHRAEIARQVKETYPVDMGQRAICEHCGSTYFKKRVNEEKNTQDTSDDRKSGE